MEIICSNNDYRIIVDVTSTYIIIFKVQVKILFFWITIKEFKDFNYEDNAENCRLNAIELYNKLIN